MKYMFLSINEIVVIPKQYYIEKILVWFEKKTKKVKELDSETNFDALHC
jgi:hypothetical protein